MPSYNMVSCISCRMHAPFAGTGLQSLHLRYDDKKCSRCSAPLKIWTIDFPNQGDNDCVPPKPKFMGNLCVVTNEVRLAIIEELLVDPNDISWWLNGTNR